MLSGAHIRLALVVLCLALLPSQGWGGELAADNFNRADGGLGANWTTQTTQQNPTIRSNAVEDETAGGNSSIALYTGGSISWPANQYASVAITALTTSNTRSGGVVLRGATGAVTGYYFQALGPLGGTVELRILKLVAGASSTLVTSGASETVAANDVLTAAATGVSLQLYINGVPRLTTTDAEITGGNPGLIVSAAVLSEARFYNWSAGSTGGGSLLLLGVQ